MKDMKKIFEDMYDMLWDFIYKLAEYFGWEISDPNA